MKRKHEQSIIDGFFDRLKREAANLGRAATRCSLDGQDSILGADYIFTTSSNFMMVEFKYERTDVRHESTKERRLTLCKNLDANEDWRELSLACHYIAWSYAWEQSRGMHFNPYYCEVCNQLIFGKSSGLEIEAAKSDILLKANSLIDGFFKGNLGLDFADFEKYTNWLLSLDESGETAIELIVDNPDGDEFFLMDFKSVRDLKIWLDRVTFIQPKPRPRGPGRSGGPSNG